jgi:hypothetical protein
MRASASNPAPFSRARRNGARNGAKNGAVTRERGVCSIGVTVML